MRFASLAIASLLISLAAACSSGVSRTSDARASSRSTGLPTARNAPGGAAAAYEVHEWGLLRGTPQDSVMLSGPRAEPQPMVMAKPVLYFHRQGVGALVIDVAVRIPGGRIVEHWPITGSAAGDRVAWSGVMLQSGACRGSRYPTLAEAPCSVIADGCESATLATVETTDSDCVLWPRAASAGGPTQAWNHLFYRGETTSAPPLPLRISTAENGAIRVTATGDHTIAGQLVRIRRANGVAGVTDAADVLSAPAPGASVVMPAPSGSLAAARASLAASLRAARLTDGEAEAFRRSWDDAIFGPRAGASATTTPPQLTAETTTVAGPAPVPRATTAVLYVLAGSSADALATLTFSPPPRTVRRAIAVWIDDG